MIRLNLIDAAERASVMNTVSPVRVTDISAQGQQSKKKAMTGLLAAAFVVVGFSCFLSVFGVPAPLQGIFPSAYLDLIGAEDPSRSALVLSNGQVTTAGGSLEAQAAAAAEAAKMRDATPVKQIVGEINPRALFNNNRAEYSSFLPMEKISFQRSSLNQFFTFLNTATPEDVGFSDCIYQAPNYFYVRGVAAKPTSQRNFLERVKQVSSDFRTPPLPENAPATDITAFGLFNVNNVNMNAVTTFIPSAELAEEIKAAKALATANKVTLNGLDKPAVEDFGVYKRYTYQVSTSADFPDLQAFVAALATSPVRMGVEKAELKFARRDLLTSMRVVMFVAP